MGTVCSWCGKKLTFWDMPYVKEIVGDHVFCVCEECVSKIESAKNGEITLDEIATEKTEPILFNYLDDVRNEALQDTELDQERQQIKEEARYTNPLYDDLHQIANDLRFIKNYLVFTIIVGIIGGIFLLLSLG